MFDVDETHFDDGGTRVPATSDNGGESDFYMNLALAHGVNLETLLEICADLANHLGEHGSGARPEASAAAHSAMLQKLFRWLITDCDNLWLGVRLFAYALDHPRLDEALNFQCPTDFARQCDQSRANAIKMLSQIQREFKLPRRRGQRTDEARQNMRTRRESQLIKPKT